MTKLFKKAAMLVLGGAVFVISFAWDGQVSSSGPTLIAPAQARVGRPLTPISYAGVARRTTRRAVVATGAAVMAEAQPVYAAPTTVVVAAPTTRTPWSTGSIPTAPSHAPADKGSPNRKEVGPCWWSIHDGR